MTVDLLVASFRLEGFPAGPHPIRPRGSASTSGDLDRPDAADVAIRAKGLWSAMVRRLRRPFQARAAVEG